MTITDVAAYAHLSEADVEALATELDAIRTDVEASLGTRDAAYIRGTVALVGGSKGGRTLLANVLRNLWAYVVIFCGHFPDGAAKFDPAVLEDETRGAWYLRQTLGSADFHAGPRRTPKRSCRDARGVPACVARSSGARCPARSPW